MATVGAWRTSLTGGVPDVHVSVRATSRSAHVAQGHEPSEPIRALSSQAAVLGAHGWSSTPFDGGAEPWACPWKSR